MDPRDRGPIPHTRRVRCRSVVAGCVLSASFSGCTSEDRADEPRRTGAESACAPRTSLRPCLSEAWAKASSAPSTSTTTDAARSCPAGRPSHGRSRRSSSSAPAVGLHPGPRCQRRARSVRRGRRAVRADRDGAVGCEDFDVSGRRDLVLVSATRQGEGAVAHFEAYRIVRATARRVGARDRVLDHMPDFNERLVASC